ncbi:MAG: chromate transporter [Eubacterium sp.]|nr:chromate transporter [Eubacterium sp.]
MPVLAELFLTFAKVGVMTFGGGYAMLPILQREIVENKGWATEDQLADYYAVGQCTPGVIAVNTATFVGQSQAGIIGGIVATLGVVFPSIVIILLIAAFLRNFMHLEAVGHAFNGVRAGVTALILTSVIKLFKGAVKDRFTTVLYVIVLALAALGNFVIIPASVPAAAQTLWNVVTSPVFLVIAAGAAGFAVRFRKGGQKK